MGIRCTTVAPETTNIRTEKREQKEDVTFTSIFLGKGQFLFQQSQKGQLTSPFKIRRKLARSLGKTPTKPPLHHSPAILIHLFSHPGSLLISIKKHFHLPTFFHLTISYKINS